MTPSSAPSSRKTLASALGIKYICGPPAALEIHLPYAECTTWAIEKPTGASFMSLYVLGKRCSTCRAGHQVLTLSCATFLRLRPLPLPCVDTRIRRWRVG